MKTSLYINLAKSTIKRHKNLYVPFMINSIFLLIITTICVNLNDKDLLNIIGRRTFISTISDLAYYIMIVFSAIIILSTYNFIRKKKYEENGLYMVLGMEKKHIIKIMFWELLYVSIFVIIVGCLLGFVFYKLAIGIYAKMIDIEANIFQNGIFQNPIPTLKTGLVFLIIFLILFLINAFKIRKFSAIELLRESKAGEKKTKFNLIKTIFGVLSLVAGYYISITTTNPLKATVNLFIAVILVIIGTYLSFSVIISFILNLLKKNNKFYFKKENFVAVSGLMYRVRNSSRTLSAITILSTSVVVILTSGLSLYLGTNEKIENILPTDYVIYHNLIGKKEDSNLEDSINRYLSDKNLEAKYDRYKTYITLAYREKDKVTAIPENIEIGGYDNYDSFVNINLIYTNNHDDVFKNSKIINVKMDDKVGNINLKNYDRKIKSINYKDFDFKFSKEANIMDSYYLVTNDLEIFNNLKKLVIPKNEVAFSMYEEVVLIDKLNKNKNRDNFEKNIISNLKGNGIEDVYSESKEEKIEEIDGNSSIFFMGILLGIAFLASTAMFIYYKQLTEGYDDIYRFKIMRQVGLTDNEAKNTVTKQIVSVFILPVAFTIMHTAFAIPVLSQFLKAAGLLNKNIMLKSMLISAIIFFAFYFVVFIMTERVYLNLILEKNK